MSEQAPRDTGSRDAGRSVRAGRSVTEADVRMLNRVVIAATLALAVASSAAAQSTTTASGQGQPSATSRRGQPRRRRRPSTDVETRPATTTFMGDTGLWYVPTGEVLPRKRWSMSAYRVNFDDNQGFTDVSNWPLTFAVGAGDHAEIFGSWVLVSRDRPRHPTAVPVVDSAGRRRRAAESADGRHLERQQTRRPVARRQVEPDVAVAAEAGGLRAAADDEDSDRQHDRRRQHRQGWTSPSTRSSARKSTSASRTPG